MTTFALKCYTARTFHGAHSCTPLEIRGSWSVSGPQPVKDDGGVPQWVADLFDSMPHLQCIALGSDSNGVVYSRIKEEPTHGNSR